MPHRRLNKQIKASAPLRRAVMQQLRVLKVSNILLFLMALGAGIGTFPDFFKSVSFREIYHQIWFLILLGMLGTGCFIAAFYRIAAITFKRKSPGFSTEADFENFKEMAPRQINIPYSTFVKKLDGLSGLASQKKYRIHWTQKKDQHVGLAQKNGWGRWGAPIIHLGFALVLVGGLLTFRFANIFDMTLPEGETVSLPGTDIKARLEKFSILMHSDHAKPKEYVSRLLIEKKGEAAFRYPLRVNHPLMIGGLKIFQMRYQVEILDVDLSVFRGGQFVESIRLKPRELRSAQKASLSLRIEEVVPDFVMDAAGKVTSRSPYFLNSAVLLSVIDNTRTRTDPSKIWVFRDWVQHNDKKSPERSFTLTRIRKRFLSGVKVSQDPGVPFAYFGFGLLMAGAFLCGFIVPSSLIFRLRKGSDGVSTIFQAAYEPSADDYRIKREIVEIETSIQHEFERREA